MQPFAATDMGQKFGGFSNMAGDSHIEFVYCGARGGVADKHLSDLLCLGTS